VSAERRVMEVILVMTVIQVTPFDPLASTPDLWSRRDLSALFF